jgi:hypothetical protein
MLSDIRKTQSATIDSRSGYRAHASELPSLTRPGLFGD